ncbi:DUF4365 domain-containing protein [Rothia nasimurium]
MDKGMVSHQRVRQNRNYAIERRGVNFARLLLEENNFTVIEVPRENDLGFDLLVDYCFQYCIEYSDFKDADSKLNNVTYSSPSGRMFGVQVKASNSFKGDEEWRVTIEYKNLYYWNESSFRIAIFAVGTTGEIRYKVFDNESLDKVVKELTYFPGGQDNPNQRSVLPQKTKQFIFRKDDILDDQNLDDLITWAHYDSINDKFLVEKMKFCITPNRGAFERLLPYMETMVTEHPEDVDDLILFALREDILEMDISLVALASSAVIYKQYKKCVNYEGINYDLLKAEYNKLSEKGFHELASADNFIEKVFTLEYTEYASEEFCYNIENGAYIKFNDGDSLDYSIMSFVSKNLKAKCNKNFGYNLLDFFCGFSLPFLDDEFVEKAAIILRNSIDFEDLEDDLIWRDSYQFRLIKSMLLMRYLLCVKPVESYCYTVDEGIENLLCDALNRGNYDSLTNFNHQVPLLKSE